MDRDRDRSTSPTDWKGALRDSGREIYRQDLKCNEKSSARLDFNPFPDDMLQKKMDFFFLPYNYS